MEISLLPAVIKDLPRLLVDVDFLQQRLDRTYFQIHFNVVSLQQLVNQLEEYRRMDGLLLLTSLPSQELLLMIEDGIQMLRRQRWQLNQVLAILLVVRAVTYARNHPRPVAGVLLAGVSAAVVPGFSSFVRFSVVMLDFLLASYRPRPGVYRP